MIWLDATLSQIANSELSDDDDKAKLMIWATELSEICDRFAPLAPVPEVYSDQVWCRVGWWVPNEQRLLSLVIRTDESVITLKMKHGAAESDVTSPNLSVVQSAVRSFFDKWSTQ